MASHIPSSLPHGLTVVSMPILTSVTPPGNGPASAWIAGSGPGTTKERCNPDRYFFHYYRYLPIPFAPHNATRFTKVIKYYLMIFVRRIYLVEETL